eukprot:gene34378-61492_t
MGFVSVKNFTILLALACIVLTAVICTALAVVSGDSALASTKDADEAGLRRARCSQTPSNKTDDWDWIVKQKQL